MTRLVFVHGLGDDVTAWGSTLAQPSLADFECVAVNVPGFGGREWNGELLATAAHAIWDEHGGEGTVMVGHSMGGTIVSLLAESNPAGLAGIVNIEGNLCETGAFLSSKAAAATDFDAWFQRFSAKQPDRYRSALGRCDPEAFLACSKDLFGLSRNDSLGRRYVALEVPKFYVLGNTRVEATVGRFLDNGERFVELEAGHWVMEDQPVAVAEQISGWIRK